MKYNGVKKKGVLSLVYPFQLWSSCGMGWENSFGIIRVDYHRLKEENKKEERIESNKTKQKLMLIQRVLADFPFYSPPPVVCSASL